MLSPQNSKDIMNLIYIKCGSESNYIINYYFSQEFKFEATKLSTLCTDKKVALAGVTPEKNRDSG